MACQKGLRMARRFGARASRKMRMERGHGVSILTRPWPLFLLARTLPAGGGTHALGRGEASSLHWGGYCDARQKEKALCRVFLLGVRSFLEAGHFLAARPPFPVKGPPFLDRACGSLLLDPCVCLALVFNFFNSSMYF